MITILPLKLRDREYM